MNHHRNHRFVRSLPVWLWLTTSTTLAQGILLPIDESRPAVPVVYQRVEVLVREQAAQTRIEQEFKNTSSQPVEAVYLFPVPAGASVHDFALWVNGKRTEAEMIDASQARQIYADTVRRLRDPGLLERMNDQLVRVRVFPIPPQGTQRIELAYAEILSREQGLTEYVLPRASTTPATTTEKDFTLRVDIEGKTPIQNLYSPTHSVGIHRQGDHRAVVGFEANRSTLTQDFRLLWSTGEQPVGLAAVWYREAATEDGYVLLLLSPNQTLASQQRVARDLVFVVDTSGSMAGQKWEQAKGALKHGIAQLGPDDRFGIVRFSTLAEPWEKTLVDSSPQNRERALQWLNGLEPTGGTAIASALEEAFKFRSSDGRALTIAFLTDGQPTIGITDPKAILAILDRSIADQTRLFSFGVGDDVQAPLLDQMAEKTRGTTTYVRPSENIETKVSAFFSKMSHPVLTDLSIHLTNPKLTLREMYPPRLPDLFHGSQLVVLARFTGSGASLARFEGKIGDRTETIEQELNLPAEPSGSDFIAPLWAQRKVGYLLDQIRLHGENKELVDEVTRLGKKFGILTPYTSFLANPEGNVSPLAGEPSPPPREDHPMPRPILPQGGPARGAKGLDASATGSSGLARSNESGPPRFAWDQESGAAAIETAQILDSMKSAERTAEQVRRVAGRAFHRTEGTWAEAGLDQDQPILSIEYLSPAYFELMELDPSHPKILALGPRLRFRAPSGLILVIGEKGIAHLTEPDRQRLKKNPS